MSGLPSTLTYFANLPTIGQVLNQLALPLKSVDKLGDPFMADQSTPMTFSQEELFNASVKHIVQAILGPSPPRGQQNHPLQKAIMRWRLENRFHDENEIKTALHGLLPSIVQKTFNEAKQTHQQWIDFVAAKQLVILYDKFQDLDLWMQNGIAHKGAAIKFKCTTDSIFEHCAPVSYTKIPASTVNLKQYIEFMMGIRPEIHFDPQQALLTQNYAMRHQKEWRLILDENQHEDEWLKFPLDLIQSVYIGALVSENAVEQLKNHIARLNPRILVYQAKCRTNEYSLDFIKISESNKIEENNPE